MRNRIWTRSRVAVLPALVALASIPATATGSSTGQIRSQDDSPDRVSGDLGPAAKRAVVRGYLVPDEAEYRRQKDDAAAAAGRAPTEDESAEESLSAALAPSSVRGWNGIFDNSSAPSDSTGAVGVTRYIELVNRRFAIYNKTSNVPLAEDDLDVLTASPAGANVFDPQVIWDGQTRRFYYVTDEVRTSTDNRLAIGWSKTASPSNGTTDWCHYNLGYGARFPDYPKLGDSRNFLLIGVNTFQPSFTGSDVVALTKPAGGTTCATPASIGVTIEADLAAPGGGADSAFTPVPANQTDTSPLGWVVARTASLPSNTFSLHRVRRDAVTGDAIIANPGVRVAVPSHTVPPDAAQMSTAKVLDTLDARPTQAVSAIDPSRGNVNAVWTQHTVIGGSGRGIVRWYEIDPVARTLLQSGFVASGFHNFNAAISPNRAVNGVTTSGGESMVLGFTRSSSTSFPQLAMVSKIGAAAQSAAVVVRNSPGPYVGFDCAGADNFCRWGDYSAATPDPNPPAGTSRVWLTNQYASGGTSTAQANWLTWNWVASP